MGRRRTMKARRFDGWAVSWSWVAAGFLGVISLTAYPANRLAPDIHTEYVKIPSGRDTITAYLAYPERKDPAPAVVVIHEIFGMSDFIRQTAEQLAKDGFVAIAPDLLSRRGGRGRPDLPQGLPLLDLSRRRARIPAHPREAGGGGQRVGACDSVLQGDSGALRALSAHIRLRPVQRRIGPGEHVAHGRRDREVRLDAGAGKLGAVRRRVMRDGELHRPAFGERERGDVAGAAGGGLADEDPAAAGPERGEEVLRRPGGSGPSEHRDGAAVRRRGAAGSNGVGGRRVPRRGGVGLVPPPGDGAGLGRLPAPPDAPPTGEAAEDLVAELGPASSPGGAAQIHHQALHTAEVGKGAVEAPHLVGVAERVEPHDDHASRQRLHRERGRLERPAVVE